MRVFGLGFLASGLLEVAESTVGSIILALEAALVGAECGDGATIFVQVLESEGETGDLAAIRMLEGSGVEAMIEESGLDGPGALEAPRSGAHLNDALVLGGSLRVEFVHEGLEEFVVAFRGFIGKDDGFRV